jgi:hypothetical protein
MVTKTEKLTLIKLNDLENKFGKLIPLDRLEENSMKDVESLIKKKVLIKPRKGFVMFVLKPRIGNDIIESERLICRIEHTGVEEPSRIFCDKVEYMHDRGDDKMFGRIFDHHIMAWNKNNLVFKVW